MKESKPKSKFPTMDNSAATTAKNASAEGTSGKLVAKKNNQAGDPATQAKPSPANLRVRAGRAYGITAKMPAWNDPQIAPVQSNGRLFTSAVNRTAVNFQEGIADHD